jgi:hypothetical protein
VIPGPASSVHTAKAWEPGLVGQVSGLELDLACLLETRF